MADWFLDGVTAWLAKLVQSMLSGLQSFLTNTIFSSPDVTVFPQVQMLAGRSAMVVNAVFVLAIIAAGAIAMTHGTLQIRYTAKDLLPRLVVGFVLSNFGVELCHIVIETANAVTRAMAGEATGGPAVIKFVQLRIAVAMTHQAEAAFAAVIGLLIVILLFCVLLAWFSRIAALIVLAGIAPAALACYCLPQLQPAAQLWWRSLLGCLAIPMLQAVTFSASVSLLLDPKYNLPILLGLPQAMPTTDVLNLFIVACLLWFTVRIPKMVGRYVTRTGQSMSPLGVVLRALVIQSITRSLRVPAGRGAPRAAAVRKPPKPFAFTR